ncbi:MAG: thiamine-phosphate kinase [Bythopirellula sp.]|nr:thiamine-phosphate kinase [Bythopirellula sp.]
MPLESELISWLEKNLPTGERMKIALGDDAAVIAASRADSVVTTDMLTDGVDFLLEQVDPQLVGRKALGVNLSDLAAMAAQPVAAFVSLVLPRQGTSKLSALELAIELYRGMIPFAAKYGMVIAGGDTNTWDGPLAISVTAIGETTPRGPLTRSGAKIGDQVLVTGSLGGSILGKHLELEPRISEALLLNERFVLHAGIDISDGLAIDAARLAQASGCGIVLDPTLIPIADAACRLSERDGRSPLEHALSDGEDFELLLAVPTDAAREILSAQPLAIPITRIGEVIAEPGLWQLISGKRQPLEPKGYEHQAEA